MVSLQYFYLIYFKFLYDGTLKNTSIKCVVLNYGTDLLEHLKKYKYKDLKLVKRIDF